MQPSSVGWYLEGRLIVVFVINLVILVVDFVRRTRCAAPLVHMGTYPVVANNDKIGYNIPSLTVGK